MRWRALRTERLLEAPRCVLGDILVEGPGRRARLEDALDGAMLEGTEPRGMRERSVEVLGGIASAEHEDAARLVTPDARGARAQQAKERGAAGPQAVERHRELVEIHRAPAARRWVESRGVELLPGAGRRKLVTGDARKVGGVDEQLALGDAHGQDVGHVVVRDGVAIARPVDEAVDAAHAVDDARGVVGVARQRHQMRLLLGEPVEAGPTVAASRVDNPVEPIDELSAHVVEVAKRTAVEERPLEVPECALGPRLGIWVAAYRAGPKLIVSRECQKAWIVDGLCALPARHHGLLAVVDAAMSAAFEAVECLLVPVHQRVEVTGRVDRVRLARAARARESGSRPITAPSRAA